MNECKVHDLTLVPPVFHCVFSTLQWAPVSSSTALWEAQTPGGLRGDCPPPAWPRLQDGPPAAIKELHPVLRGRGQSQGGEGHWAWGVRGAQAPGEGPPSVRQGPHTPPQPTVHTRGERAADQPPAPLTDPNLKGPSPGGSITWTVHHLNGSHRPVTAGSKVPHNWLRVSGVLKNKTIH